MERRLSAILAADVVGYSRLMEQDEAGTLIALKARRKQVLEPLVARHQGRVFKVTGDGVLIEFGSAVNAVQCAIDLQEGMAVANGDLPGDRHIVLRIGINLGDVIVEGGDRYGDGVNIAARLEGIAEPGGILISGTTYDHSRNKVSAGFEDLGAQGLKNIAEPVRTYRITGTLHKTVATHKVSIDKPSIAILPFANMSGDPDQQYFSDGITEDLITEMSKINCLLVIARNSTFQYRDKSIDIRRVGRELGAQYVVEGSVRRSGSRVRITAQLIDADSGNHIWAERFDRTLEDIFALQDEVTEAIVGALPRRLEDAALERARRKPVTSLSAYEYLLHAEWMWLHSGNNEEILALLEKAVRADPRYARAHARLAQIHAYLHVMGQLSSDENCRKAQDCAQRAVSFDDADARIHGLVAASYLLCGPHDLADYHSDKAIALNPNDAEVMFRRGCTLAYRGDPQTALDWFRRAMRLDPQRPSFREAIFDAHYMARDYEGAIALYQGWSNPPIHMIVEAAACYAQLDRTEETRLTLAEFMQRRPENYDLAAFVRAHLAMCRRPEDREHWLDGYRKTRLIA
jgi:adenylate cyclase